MRIYLSGPITGTNDYLGRFEVAEKKLAKLGYSIINPAKVCAQLPEDTKYEQYMKVCIAMLETADAIYMMEGWRESIGACKEYSMATFLGIHVLMEEGEFKWG